MPDVLFDLLRIIAALAIFRGITEIIWMETVTEAGGFIYGIVPGFVAALLVFIYAPTGVAVILAIGVTLSHQGLELYRRKFIIEPMAQEEHTRRMEAAHLMLDAAGKRQILVPRGYAYPETLDSSLTEPVLVVDFDTRLQNLARHEGTIQNVRAEYHLFPFNDMTYWSSPGTSLYMFIMFDIEQQGYVIPIKITEGRVPGKMTLDYPGGNPIFRLMKAINRLRLAPYDPATYERRLECYNKYSSPERHRQLASLYEATVAEMPSVRIEWSELSMKDVIAGDGWELRQDDQTKLMKSPFTHFRPPPAHLTFSYMLASNVVTIYFAALLQNGISPDANPCKHLTDLPTLQY